MRAAETSTRGERAYHALHAKVVRPAAHTPCFDFDAICFCGSDY